MEYVNLVSFSHPTPILLFYVFGCKFYVLLFVLGFSSTKAAMSSDGVDEILDKKLVGTCSLEQVRSLAAIAHKCIHRTPRKRPSMGEISHAILRIRQRRLVKEDTMSFTGYDSSRMASRIENQQVELRNMVSINERS